MNHYKHILVCLDLTHIDEYLIKYTAFLAELMHAKKITFLHVLQAYDISAATKEDYTQVKQSMYEHVKKTIHKHLQKTVMENLNIRIVIRIEEKDASDEIIKYVRKHHVGLTVFGKKGEEERKERYSARGIALAECDMLVVPEDPPSKLDHLLVVSDFSRQSVDAFKTAATLAKRAHAGISCQYVFSVPKHFFPVTSPQAMYDFVKKQGEKKSKRFQKKHKHLLTIDNCYLAPGTYNQQDEKIFSTVEETHSDLIVLGTKGQTSNQTTLLGKITAKLRKYNSNIPVLIIKNFQEKNSFWNMFFHG